MLMFNGNDSTFSLNFQLMIFREKHERVNIKHFDANHTVQFQQRRSWHFLEDLSNGTLKENITNFNVPLMVISSNPSTLIISWLVNEWTLKEWWNKWSLVSRLLFTPYVSNGCPPKSFSISLLRGWVFNPSSRKLPLNFFSMDTTTLFWNWQRTFLRESFLLSINSPGFIK